jgi:hypothetical protein
MRMIGRHIKIPSYIPLFSSILAVILYSEKTVLKQKPIELRPATPNIINNIKYKT